MTLSGMTNLLGANIFVADLVAGSAQSLQGFLPIIILQWQQVWLLPQEHHGERLES